MEHLHHLIILDKEQDYIKRNMIQVVFVNQLIQLDQVE